MCVNYTPPKREVFDLFNLPVPKEMTWPAETYQDYVAPIIRRSQEGSKEVILASYGMVPKRHIPPTVKKFTTMNARAETVGQLRSYANAWRAGQLCLVPMEFFFEPNWETGSHVRWSIGMADESPFAVAGLWRTWSEEDGSTAHSFTQITVNADEHPLMRRFHRPNTEKRSLVILPSTEYDDWLECRDPERARSFFQLYPAELMAATPAPKPLKSAGNA